MLLAQSTFGPSARRLGRRNTFGYLMAGRRARRVPSSEPIQSVTRIPGSRTPHHILTRHFIFPYRGLCQVEFDGLCPLVDLSIPVGCFHRLRLLTGAPAAVRVVFTQREHPEECQDLTSPDPGIEFPQTACAEDACEMTCNKSHPRRLGPTRTPTQPRTLRCPMT